MFVEVVVGNAQDQPLPLLCRGPGLGEFWAWPFLCLSWPSSSGLPWAFPPWPFVGFPLLLWLFLGFASIFWPFVGFPLSPGLLLGLSCTSPGSAHGILSSKPLLGFSGPLLGLSWASPGPGYWVAVFAATWARTSFEIPRTEKTKPRKRKNNRPPENKQHDRKWPQPS